VFPNHKENTMSALDTVIRGLEKELEDKKSAYEAILANAAENDREPNDSEKETLGHLTNRMAAINESLSDYDRTEQVIGQFTTRAKELDQAIATRRAAPNGVEYRSAGHYALDAYKSALGDREASERLEVFYRAAAHQKTTDNLGVIPDPIVGDVVNFIDAARPMVQAVGPQPLPSNTWHRPHVTQNTSVDVQGTAGAAADEKLELVSQKMTITRLTANAVTYGGYVNVSRQNIDFSNGQVLDIIIRDLAAQYAIQTEAAFGTELDASTATAVGYGASPTADTVRAALWAAVGDIYAVTKGQGRIVLAVAPDRLEAFGPLFPPIFGVTEDGEGLRAGSFGSGTVGGISGIQVVMSAGLASGKAFLFSTAAIEAFEQRVGTLQVTEPSVMGVQVAYAGYFTPLTIDDGGIIELTAT
jgi:HK97 family phage major capsid protein